MSSCVLPAKLKVEHCFNLYHHECEIELQIHTPSYRHIALEAFLGVHT